MTRRSTLVSVLGLTVALVVLGFVAFPAAVWGFGIDAGESTPPLTYLGFLVSLYATIIVVGLAYLRLHGLGTSYLDFRRPTLRDLGYVIGGVVLGFGVSVVLSLVAYGLALPEPPGSIFTEIELSNPTNYLVFVPFALLVNGPVEETLFRGLIQRRLAGEYGRWPAVLGASAAFSVFHVPAFYGVLLTPEPPLIGLAVALVAFAVFGVVLGLAYALTENLTVPALIHGIYNAVLGLLAFYSVGGAV